MNAVTKGRVLYVEDDPAQGYLLRSYLKEIGYHADHVLDTDTGFRMLRDHGYDMLLLDQNVGTIGGLEVLRQLAEEDALLPTVMVSGALDDDMAEEAMTLGAKAFLLKGMGFLEELSSVMEEFLTNGVVLDAVAAH